MALASGKTLEADAAILALPLPAAETIEVNLSASQTALLKQIDYHKVVQLHCIVEAPFWEARWLERLLVDRWFARQDFYPPHSQYPPLQHDGVD